MKKSHITIAITLLALVTGIVIFLLLTQRDSATSTTTLDDNPQNAEVINEDAASANESNTEDGDKNEDGQSRGEYLEYDESKLAQSSNDNYLFFHAVWCSQCRALEADIEAQGLPAGVSVFKVDYDSNHSLRQKYGVTQQTTLVKVDKNGEKIGENYVAYQDPSVDALKKDLFN